MSIFYSFFEMLNWGDGEPGSSEGLAKQFDSK